METRTTFTSDKEPLQEILRSIEIGKIQLPEFQRGWVWDDDHIKSLLASISLSYPIGAIMTLENGNPDVKFKPRPFEGLIFKNSNEPERFILDGQQRLTALFQTLWTKSAVRTRNIKRKEIKRWYYIDMQKALNSTVDIEEAIIGLPEDKISKNFRNEINIDLSKSSSEYLNCYFPVNLIFSSSDWRREYHDYWNHDREKSKLFDQFEAKIIKQFEQYQIPIIKLLKETPKVAVCQVFEKVNTGGVSLTVFELVTASFAIDGYNLREDWEGIQDDKNNLGRKAKLHKEKSVDSIGPDELLQAISLITTYKRKPKDSEGAVSCKRNEILKLTLNDYKKYADVATNSFLKTSKFLFQQKIFRSSDLPYGSQLVPLSAIYAILGEDAEKDIVRKKLIQWFWSGVFGELYGSAVESRFSRDVVQVPEWINGGEEPSTVSECNIAPNRLDTLRTRNSAAYKGLYALLMRDGCLDFMTGETIEVKTYFDENIDIHHIFPEDWCNKNKIDKKYYDSIINKTAIGARTNRKIGGHAPSIYLKNLCDNKAISASRQDEILASHLINVDAIRQDDFIKFYAARKESLLKRIEEAIGKRINRDINDNSLDI